jgi:uncharacterized protein (UPF0332 family)
MNEEPMTPEQRADLVSYYFERAHESIAEAKYLRDGGYFNGAVTRLYYEAYAFRDASSVEYLLPKAEAFVEAVESLAKKV